MNNLARKLELHEVHQQVGTVLRQLGAHVVVRTPTGDVTAARAASCLLAPRADDQVLVACLPTGLAYVLAVLVRDDPVTELRVDGSLRIQAPHGRVAVAAQQGVTIASGDDLSLVGGRLEVQAVEGNVVVQRLSLLGRALRAEIDKVRVLASSLDTLLERLSLRAKRSYRIVEQLDQVKAGQIDYRARQAMSLHAENALVTAEQLVKVDGEQIHLG